MKIFRFEPYVIGRKENIFIELDMGQLFHQKKFIWA